MNKITKVMSISFITNSLLSLLKVIFGSIYKSSSLIADGIHSFSDLLTDIVAIVGSFLSNKKPDKKHPYGHGNIEYLTSFIIGVVILVIGFSIIYNGVGNETIIPNKLVILISLFTIISKLLLSNYVLRSGKKYKNEILIASGKESSADVVSSVFVLLSSILMQFSNEINILKYSDIVSTIIVGLFIIKVGFDVVKNNISYIIGEQEENIDYIKEMFLVNNEIKRIDDIILLKYGSYYKLTVTISMDGDLSLKESHEIVDIIENEIKKYNNKIKYINIHIEPYDK